MSNGDAVLAPTPIVRMTSEQLEYLIAALARRASGREEKKKWKYNIVNASAPGAPPAALILGRNAYRQGFIVTAFGTAAAISVDPNVTGTQGFGIQSGVGVTIPFMFDVFGWLVTEPWYAVSGAPTPISILEITGIENLRV